MENCSKITKKLTMGKNGVLETKEYFEEEERQDMEK